MANPDLKPDTLLMLSGGIDSAWCLWQRVRAGLPTRTHHVVLSDREGRAEVEKRATSRVLAWMRANGGEHLIHHTESSVDFGGIKWLTSNYYLWAFWEGVLLSSPRGRAIQNVVIPRHYDAFPSGPASPSAARSDAAHRTLIKGISGREITLQYPMIDMMKADVIASMPESLLKLCWYCRRPRDGRPCGVCKTCRQVAPALAARNMEGTEVDMLMTDGHTTLKVTGDAQVAALRACGYAPVASEPEPPTTPVPVEPRPVPVPALHAPAVGDAPPRNASRKVWAEFAESLGIDVTGLTRGAIQEAVNQKG